MRKVSVERPPRSNVDFSLSLALYITYYIIIFVKKSDNFSAGEYIFRARRFVTVSENPCPIYYSKPVVSTVSNTFYFSNIQFNIIFLSTHKSFKWPLCLRFYDHIFYIIIYLLYPGLHGTWATRLA
jgi:hypothetical protein